MNTLHSRGPGHRASTPRRGLVALAAMTALALTGCTAGSAQSSSSGSQAAPSQSAASGGASGAASGSSQSNSGQAGGDGPAAALQRQYVHVVDEVLPSIVEIRTQKALGSGILYDNKGHVVTNAHVVGSATSFEVLLPSRARPVKASLVGTYAPDDLAVIKLASTPNVTPAQFGDSGKLQVGDIVLAMGNPLGLSGTVTQGIVSAVGRTVSEPQGGHSPGATLASAIQTSAAINPGNSGGALVDLSGKVVGIPTLAAVDQEIGGAAPGIGFAIPSNTVTNIADQLIKSGHVTSSHRAALNVRVRTVVGPNGQPAGVGIVQVQQGGAAAKAGLKAGEVIVAVNGHQVSTAPDLQVLLAQLHPGDTVKVTVVSQSGQKKTVSVKLGQLKV
ncbi:MAG TPA: trypsin-like peptidase domain-containing protein [Segeticoccus sp.]|uniref:S1C family serine protease n=1 Tax=Segeticoccus sp. TaxID=2706531 RepID=UPI002D7E658F|nr:trypsin-like peptidase domain-containing protein [Segeticoccus sp.]HET8600014.1 trypsin-like peptidase domain-containing protein [Segeticoccus sp.]